MATQRTNPLEYSSWRAAKTRCFNKTAKDYATYGGRGVTMHPLWANSFRAFFEDMGPRPSPKHSLDRIDHDGHYEPKNCRWATANEQARNRDESGKLLDRVGQRNGLLVYEALVLLYDDEPIRAWRCLCDCGNYTYVTPDMAGRGNKKSCGCLGWKSASTRKKAQITPQARERMLRGIRNSSRKGRIAHRAGRVRNVIVTPRFDLNDFSRSPRTDTDL